MVITPKAWEYVEIIPLSRSITRSARRSPAKKFTGVGIKRILTRISAQRRSVKVVIRRQVTFPDVVTAAAAVHLNVFVVTAVIESVASTPLPVVKSK